MMLRLSIYLRDSFRYCFNSFIVVVDRVTFIYRKNSKTSIFFMTILDENLVNVKVLYVRHNYNNCRFASSIQLDC